MNAAARIGACLNEIFRAVPHELRLPELLRRYALLVTEAAGLKEAVLFVRIVPMRGPFPVRSDGFPEGIKGPGVSIYVRPGPSEPVATGYGSIFGVGGAREAAASNRPDMLNYPDIWSEPDLVKAVCRHMGEKIYPMMPPEDAPRDAFEGPVLMEAFAGVLYHVLREGRNRDADDKRFETEREARLEQFPALADIPLQTARAVAGRISRMRVPVPPQVVPLAHFRRMQGLGPGPALAAFLTKRPPHGIGLTQAEAARAIGVRARQIEGWAATARRAQKDKQSDSPLERERTGD